MKKNEIAAIRKKDLNDLKKVVSEKRAEARAAYSEMKAGKSTNLKKYKNQRREIAQILTIIREKEILENSNFLLQKESQAKKKSQ